jgi:hypothetical protein
MSEAWNEPRKHFIQCDHCEESRNATERGQAETRNDEFGPPLLVTLVQCDTCTSPLLFAQEDYGRGYDEMGRVWPTPVRYLSNAIPEELRDVHAEARKCFSAKAYTAAVVMVGRTLEGVCIKNDIKKRNLVQGLEELRTRGLIDDRLFEWTQALRVLRNEGAHFTGMLVSRADARDALQLSEALLDYMYVLTARFEEFKARRASSAVKGDDSE